MALPYKRIILGVELLSFALARFISSPLKSTLRFLFRNFDRWSRFKQHFAQNLIIGIIIELLVHTASHYQIQAVVEAQDSVLDWMMQVSVGSAPGRKERSPIIFVDVNERTYRDPAWGGGEPSAIPLQALAKLIEYSFEKGANYIIIDFVVDGHIDSRQQLFSHKLEALINRYPESHLFFVRTFRRPLQRLTSQELRPSIIDQLIEKYPTRIHPVAPNFLRTKSDQIVRHWRLWEPACKRLPDGKPGEGRWVIVPSPQLAIAAVNGGTVPPWQASWRKSPIMGYEKCIVDGVDDDEVIESAKTERVAEFMVGKWVTKILGTCYVQGTFTPDDCNTTEDLPQPINVIEDAAKEMQDELGSRVVYWIPDKSLEPGSRSTAIAKDNSIVDFVFGRSRSTEIVYNRISADNILNRDQDPLAFDHLFNEKDVIIIIAASYDDSKDFHSTPIGKMPGALIIANSIDTLLTSGILQTPNALIKYLVMIIVLVSVCAIFALLPSFFSATISAVVIGLFMVPLSFVLFKEYGAWLDLAAPMIGIYLHYSWEAFREHIDHG